MNPEKIELSCASDQGTDAVLSTPMVEGTSSEENMSGKNGKKPNLFLEIPTRTMDDSLRQELVQMKSLPTPTPTPKKVNFVLTPSHAAGPSVHGSSPGPLSSKSRSSSIRNLLPKLSFKHRSSSNPDIEKDIDSGSSEKLSSISRSWSFTKIFTPRIKRTSSFPVGPIESARGGSTSNPPTPRTKGALKYISRSLSLPVNSKEQSTQKVECFFRVIPSTPRVRDANSNASATTTAPTPYSEGDEEEEGEDIPEEEAVCRICLVELCEGGETLRMECSCKGELALAHQECAVKWFGIKGNKTCDVCKQEVLNLPVTLLKIQSVRNAGATSRLTQLEINGHSVWEEVPILVIVSMLAYFCFLEQLLVGKMGTGAIAISLPFSCVLSLVASMTASTMVKRRFVWIYASAQFALVVILSHIFYSLVHLQSIMSVLLATFAGFGVAMSGSSIVVEFSRWRSSRRRRSRDVFNRQQQNPQVVLDTHQLPDIENPET